MRLCIVLVLLVLAPLRAAAQCDATPSFTSFPDEAPVLREPAATIVARADARTARLGPERFGDPRSANWFTATFELAEAYRVMGRLEDEVRTWAFILTTAPEEPALDDVLYHLSRALLRMGEMERALQVIAYLVAHFPRSPRLEAAYAALGEHRAGAGDLVGALDAFERAARTPGRWAAYVAYRTAWIRAAQHEGRAASDFDVALTLAARAGVFVPAELTRALLTERAAVVALSACP